MISQLEPKSIHVNNTDLAYLEQGTGDAVIFVHGGGATDLRTWGAQIEPFAQRYRVVAFSLRYHYPNAWVGDGSDYAIPVHARDLAGVIQELGLVPVHVITSSYGGDVALKMTLEKPQLVRSLVLAEPPLNSWRARLNSETTSGEDSSQSWDEAARAVSSGDIEGGVRLFASRVLGKGAFDRLPESARRRMLDNARILTLPEGVLFTEFYCEDAGNIRVPTLLLTGDASPKRFLVVTDELSRCMPQAERAIIPGASHLLHGMNPLVYNKTVLSFLAKH